MFFIRYRIQKAIPCVAGTSVVRCSNTELPGPVLVKPAAVLESEWCTKVPIGRMMPKSTRRTCGGEFGRGVQESALGTSSIAVARRRSRFISFPLQAIQWPVSIRAPPNAAQGERRHRTIGRCPSARPWGWRIHNVPRWQYGHVYRLALAFRRLYTGSVMLGSRLPERSGGKLRFYGIERA